MTATTRPTTLARLRGGPHDGHTAYVPTLPDGAPCEVIRVTRYGRTASYKLAGVEKDGTTYYVVAEGEA